MKFTRRKALASIGMGGLALGGVFASGAFTQTEVDRDFDLAISPDPNALLGLDPTGDIEGVVKEGGVLAFNFDEFSNADGIPSQADTAFEGAFTITNKTQENIAVWMPSADEEAGDTDAQLYDAGARSTEVVVDGSNANDFSQGKGTRLNPGDNIDLTFPAEYHKDPSQESEVDASNIPSGANEQSRAFGMTPGGAVVLSSGGSVTADVNFLVLGARSSVDQRDSLLRFKAERRSDAPKAPSEWATTFRNLDSGGSTIDNLPQP